MRHERTHPPEWRLVVFDLDGTVLQGTILRALGAEFGFMGWVREMETSYAAGEISNEHITQETAERMRGQFVRRAEVALKRLMVVPDARAAVWCVNQRGIGTVVMTISFGFAARWIARELGAELSFGSELGIDELCRFTGSVDRHVEAEDKVAFLAEACAHWACHPHEAVAFGDGRSDLALFKEVGFSVAFNATDELRSVASTSFDGPSLRAGLAKVPGLL